MSEMQLSRREAIGTLSRSLLAGAVATWVSRCVTAAGDKPVDSALIDTHVHLVNSRLPRALKKTVPLAPFERADAEGPKQLARTVEEETKKAGVAYRIHAEPALELQPGGVP
jgi:hypothetical protein